MVRSLFAAFILAIPFAGALYQFVVAAVLSGLALAECSVLSMNRGRCRLTDMAGHHTEERADNFDIYLPVLLGPWNKAIFGMVFVIVQLVVLSQWLVSSL